MSEALKDITIVIVDDDSRNRFALSSYLEGRGMEIHLLDSGFQTIEFLKDNKADIILMDMMMPEMDGFETIQRLKSNEQTRDIPIIAVTAQAMKGDREKCLEAGATDYVSKPINMKQLFESIEKLLKTKDR
jgi:two-component system, chemotaxis family, sensor kinase CheA